ncbi:MAG TPA: hypothetical protein VL461_10610 [Dictyobacter sp.]|jgi:Tol biopolymer transport system component|nr:hypothetical protein [Dictyobacter sp.]
MRQKILFPLMGLCVVTLATGAIICWTIYPFLLVSTDQHAYVYYAIKDERGFVLARAPRGTDGQPLSAPEALQPFGGTFGLVDSDSVVSMQMSPDGQYLAIDGNRDHGEQVWIYDVARNKLSWKPGATSGNFLHWLPRGHAFLYRPMMPLGPDAPLDGGIWNPGLWSVDAATGIHQNIAIGVPSSELVDAVPSPDGSRIVYSTSAGLSMGSDTYVMNSTGGQQVHLFHSSGLESIAALFSWSPDGSHIAYEQLADNSVPFQTAGLWMMDSQGREQRRLADADGGHGYTVNWSPDGKQIAYVVRMNTQDVQADNDAQALQSAISIVNVQNLQVHLLASNVQTGMQLNVNPFWSAQGDRVIFTALNPINRITGGAPRYWSASIAGGADKAQVKPISPLLTHIVAWAGSR